MWDKLAAYLALVCFNAYFPLGIVLGISTKMFWGGQIISLGTGIFVGVLFYMVLQHLLLR
jgi:hypothetical protein